jgi:hypothetical protein
MSLSVCLSTVQSLSLLLVDLWPRQEARQFDSIHYVLAVDHFFDQYAIILLHQKSETIRNFSSRESIDRCCCS